MVWINCTQCLELITVHHSVTFHSRQDRFWTAWGFCMDQWTIYCFDYLCAGSVPVSSSEKSCITSGSRNPLNSEIPSVLNIWFIQLAEDYAWWGHNVKSKPATWTSWHPTWRRAERRLSEHQCEVCILLLHIFLGVSCCPTQIQLLRTLLLFCKLLLLKALDFWKILYETFKIYSVIYISSVSYCT